MAAAESVDVYIIPLVSVLNAGKAPVTGICISPFVFVTVKLPLPLALFTVNGPVPEIVPVFKIVNIPFLTSIAPVLSFETLLISIDASPLTIIFLPDVKISLINDVITKSLISASHSLP